MTRKMIRVDFNRIASGVPKILKKRGQVVERSRRDNAAIRRHAGIADPPEKPKVDFQRIARGELTRDQAVMFERIARAHGLIGPNAGERMMGEARVRNMRRDDGRKRTAAADKKEQDRLHAEARRILRDGSAPTPAEAFRSGLKGFDD